MILPDLSEIKDVNGTLLKDFVKDLCGLPNATANEEFSHPGFQRLLSAVHEEKCTGGRINGSGLRGVRAPAHRGSSRRG